MIWIKSIVNYYWKITCARTLGNKFFAGNLSDVQSRYLKQPTPEAVDEPYRSEDNEKTC